MTKSCRLWWCKDPYYAHGYCNRHWNAVRRYGNPYGRHEEDFKRINDIIEKARELAEAVYYPPGPTREDSMHCRALKIKDILGDRP
jgi:hypothetical protein